MANRFLRALSRSRDRLSGALSALVPGRRPDSETIEELEAALLAADVGPTTTAALIAVVERASDSEAVPALAAEMVAMLSDVETTPPEVSGPRVVLVVGVNGSGKTTSVAKLARFHSAGGERVLLAAADTFRAAAVDQLRMWADRVGVELVAQDDGGDPAAVAFDACQAGLARGVDRILIDTAGRLHTQGNLMQELEKIRRVTQKVIPDAPHEVLLVLDGTTGQNGLRQAEEFLRSAGVTGIILTKLDGTARGGVALTIARQVGLPIHFVGTGEGDTDLASFDATEYVHGLLGIATK
ncbi:MAG: signal recognition particle-docking protein FtsY [Acidobacteria bacterium]|nr:signal recognition particle-docking protein FtsY [Acidobacteriota bacterium]